MSLVADQKSIATAHFYNIKQVNSGSSYPYKSKYSQIFSLSCRSGLQIKPDLLKANSYMIHFRNRNEVDELLLDGDRIRQILFA